tara:strand:- start:160 stop:438 length:279 start_codon:yes stop_codon:yes gene_type:complete
MTKYFLTLAALLVAAAPSYITSAHAEMDAPEATIEEALDAAATEAQSGDEVVAEDEATSDEAVHEDEAVEGEEHGDDTVEDHGDEEHTEEAH